MAAIPNEVQTLPSGEDLSHAQTIQLIKRSTHLLAILDIPSFQKLLPQTLEASLSGIDTSLPKASAHLHYLRKYHRCPPPNQQNLRRWRGDRYRPPGKMGAHIAYERVRGPGIRRIRSRGHRVPQKRATCAAWRRMVWIPRAQVNR